MYSSRIVDSTDPDLFADSIRPIDTDLTITEHGAFRARSMSFNLGRVWAQRGRERLASLKHIDLHRYGVLFLTEPGPSMFLNGAKVGIDQIAVGRVGRSYTSRLSGPTQWGAMSLAKEDIDALCMPALALARTT